MRHRTVPGTLLSVEKALRYIDRGPANGIFENVPRGDYIICCSTVHPEQDTLKDQNFTRLDQAWKYRYQANSWRGAEFHKT